MGMKVTIVGGAGCVGSAAAFRVAQDGHASEIVLVDARRNIAQAHALDIDQAVVQRTDTRVRAGELPDTRDSDVIIVAAAPCGRPPIASRSMALEANLKLMMEVMPSLVTHSPAAFWFFVSAPVDVLVYLMHRIFSIPRNKIIGLNGNDTARLRWAIGRTLSMPAPDVEAFMLGEHGETQVPVFSHVKVSGKDLSLDVQQREAVRNKIAGFLPEWNKLQSGRTAGWTTAQSIGDVVASLASGDNLIRSCSTPLEDEYGLRDVSLGVPARLDRNGVKEIVEFELNVSERNDLKASAETIKGQIKQGQAFLDRWKRALDDLLTLLTRR